MAFFQSAVGTLQTLVVALGAGLGMVDSFETGVFHLISEEKAYNRMARHADLWYRNGLSPLY